MLNTYYLLPWSRSYRKQNKRQDSGSNNLVRKHKARASEVRNLKAVRQDVMGCNATRYCLPVNGEGTPGSLSKGFSGEAARRNHDPGSFVGEQKVEEFVCPASPFYLPVNSHPMQSYLS